RANGLTRIGGPARCWHSGRGRAADVAIVLTVPAGNRGARAPIARRRSSRRQPTLGAQPRDLPFEGGVGPNGLSLALARERRRDRARIASRRLSRSRANRCARALTSRAHL